MAQIDSPRRALTNLPVNTSATYHSTSVAKEGPATLKRLIHEVEDPEIQFATIRPRTEFHTKGLLTPKKKTTDGMDRSAGMIPHLKVMKHPRLEAADGLEELEEGSSENSSKDSMSTIADFEVGNETIGSQETVQTEITQPGESMAYLAEKLRLRLRLALFKVQTNQINIPMSRLRISTDDNHRSQGGIPTSPPFQHKSAESKLLPAPVFRPTAYSARVISREQIPSSPPQPTGNSPDMNGHVNAFETSEVPWPKKESSAHQLSRPPDSLRR